MANLIEAGYSMGFACPHGESIKIPSAELTLRWFAETRVKVLLP